MSQASTVPNASRSFCNAGRCLTIHSNFVAEKYAVIVEAFYNEAPEVEVSAEITYEDGRKAMLRSRLRVTEVDEPSLPAAEHSRRAARQPVPAEAG